MKFRSDEGIVCTGEDIFMIEKSRTYEFFGWGVLLQRENSSEKVMLVLRRKMDKQKIFRMVMTGKRSSGSHSGSCIPR